MLLSQLKFPHRCHCALTCSLVCCTHLTLLLCCIMFFTTVFWFLFSFCWFVIEPFEAPNATLSHVLPLRKTASLEQVFITPVLQCVLSTVCTAADIQSTFSPHTRPLSSQTQPLLACPSLEWADSRVFISSVTACWCGCLSSSCPSCCPHYITLIAPLSPCASLPVCRTHSCCALTHAALSSIFLPDNFWWLPVLGLFFSQCTHTHTHTSVQNDAAETEDWKAKTKTSLSGGSSLP